MDNVPEAKYRCMKCGFRWQGYRVMWHECSVVSQNPCPPDCGFAGKGFRMDDLGTTECPKCKHIYVDFMNWEDVRRALGL